MEREIPLYFKLLFAAALLVLLTLMKGVVSFLREEPARIWRLKYLCNKKLVDYARSQCQEWPLGSSLG